MLHNQHQRNIAIDKPFVLQGEDLVPPVSWEIIPQDISESWNEDREALNGRCRIFYVKGRRVEG